MPGNLAVAHGYDDASQVLSMTVSRAPAARDSRARSGVAAGCTRYRATSRIVWRQRRRFWWRAVRGSDGKSQSVLWIQISRGRLIVTAKDGEACSPSIAEQFVVAHNHVSSPMSSGGNSHIARNMTW